MRTEVSSDVPGSPCPGQVLCCISRWAIIQKPTYIAWYRSVDRKTGAVVLTGETLTVVCDLWNRTYTLMKYTFYALCTVQCEIVILEINR